MLFIQVDEKSYVDIKIYIYIVQVEWWQYLLANKNYKLKHIICRMIQKMTQVQSAIESLPVIWFL